LALKYTLIILLSLFLFGGCTDLDEESTTYINEEEYVVFPEMDGEVAYHMKKYLINYFKSIAIGSEFGDKTRVVKKWKTPMKIFLGGEPTDTLHKELGLIINEINGYATDGFSIEEVTDSLDSNFYIYFGSSSNYAKQHTYLAQLIVENKGLFTFYHESDFWIYKGHMYVDTERSFIEEQRHILREELTQALGLANDIPHDSFSIFYNQPSTTTEYSSLDIEVIRLLYHPSIIAGLGEDNVQSSLESLLGVDN